MTQNNANNAMNFTSSPSNNNKNNNNRVVPFYDCQAMAIIGLMGFIGLMRMKEYVTIEDVELAWRICKRRKASSRGCVEYSRNWLTNNLRLYRELNSMTYKIGRSNAFCISYPTYREVFCAQFRDRVVQTLACHKFEGIFEARMPDDCYACRKGKGTLYGVKRIKEQIEAVSEGYTKEAWIWKGDIKGFFMSVDRRMSYSVVERVIRESYTGADVEWWLWLWKLILLHAPEDNCVKTGDLSLWKCIPPEKSLFTNGKHKGFAIGNLPSHIIANLILSEIIGRWLGWLRERGGGGGWYVDDTSMVHCDKHILLEAVRGLRKDLKANGFMLHPRKFYLQEARKGVDFVGSTILPGRVLSSERTVGNLFKKISLYNEGKMEMADFVNSYNSYMGELTHKDAYGMRWRAWNAIRNKRGLCNRNMRYLKIINN